MVREYSNDKSSGDENWFWFYLLINFMSSQNASRHLQYQCPRVWVLCRAIYRIIFVGAQQTIILMLATSKNMSPILRRQSPQSSSPHNKRPMKHLKLFYKKPIKCLFIQRCVCMFLLCVQISFSCWLWLRLYWQTTGQGPMKPMYQTTCWSPVKDSVRFTTGSAWFKILQSCIEHRVVKYSLTRSPRTLTQTKATMQCFLWYPSYFWVCSGSRVGHQHVAFNPSTNPNEIKLLEEYFIIELVSSLLATGCAGSSSRVVIYLNKAIEQWLKYFEERERASRISRKECEQYLNLT